MFLALFEDFALKSYVAGNGALALLEAFQSSSGTKNPDPIGLLARGGNFA